MRFHKVLGKENPADLFTKHLDQTTTDSHTNALQYKFTEGRAKEAPKLHGLWKSVREYLADSRTAEWKLLQLLTGKTKKSQTAGALNMLHENKSDECGGCEQSGLNAEERTETTNGLRAAGALGNQLAGTGVQRLECRPAWPALGFDPNLPAQCWRVVGTWFETRGGHAPVGATFEGRHDPAVYMEESHPGP